MLGVAVVRDARRPPDDLLVSEPGGYRFTDYVRVGAPPQAIFAVVTTLGIPVALSLGL